MKKTIGIMIVVITLFCSCFIASAEDQISVLVDTVKVNFDVEPQIINGRTMVPVRAIFDSLGAVVKWNGDNQTVYAQKGNTKIELKIGSSLMKKNGKDIALDVPAQIIDGRTLIPARAVAESFNCLVDYIPESQTVVITPSSDLDIPRLNYGIPGYGQVTLMGEEIDEPDAGYEIYYSQNIDGPYYEYCWCGGFTDNGLICRNLEGMKTYYFKVRASVSTLNEEYDAYEIKYSLFSQPVAAKPLDALNVSVDVPKITDVIVDGTNVTVKWNLDSSVSDYTLYVDGINAFVYGCESLYADSYTFTDLNPMTEYSFSIMASKTVQGQDYSSEISEPYKIKTGAKSPVLPPNVTISNIKHKMDSAGGITYTFDINNNSSKTVKYVTVKWRVFNAVGDEIFDTISGDSFSGKVTGPIKSGESLKQLQNERKFYNSAAKSGSIDFIKLEVEYTDGTRETINNGVES